MITKMVPPDGGWGWMVVIAFALSNIVTIPISQGFGLIFKDTFTVLGITATQSSTIMNVNAAFGMILALINGPLVKKFGYKRICIAGSIFFSTGVTLTTFATSVTGFIITYGLLTSLGMGLLLSSLSLAINTYFLERRGRAMGLAMTITGLGPIIMPQVIYLLSNIYSSQMTILILGGFSLHTMIAALLLQPVEWHMKKVEILEENETAENTREGSERLEAGVEKRRRTVTLSSIEYDMEGSINGIDTPQSRKTSLNPSLYANMTGLDTENLGSSVKIFEEKAYHSLPKSEDRSNASKDKSQHYENCKRMTESVTEKQVDEKPEIEPDVIESSCFRGFVNYFDFDLLSDPIFVNIMLGMSIAVSAEINFAIMTPFILSDLNFTTDQCAMVMSTLAFTDLISRGISPFICERLTTKPRDIYLFSLFLLILGRIGLMVSTNYFSAICAVIVLGVVRGVRSVYVSLVIANHVPLEKLASATGIQMVSNGIFMMTIGPLLGYVRQSSGSKMFITGLNAMTAVTIIMWSTEKLIFRMKGMKKGKEGVNQNSTQT